MQALITFFEELGYMAHGMCLLWQPWLIALFAGSDFLIFMAYAIIPLALHRVLRARRDLENRGLAYLFVAFILLCGLTHLVAIVTLWVPAYSVQGFVKLATALVSVTTAAVLFPLVPKIVALPSPATLRVANARLTEEIAAHEATLGELRQIRDRLEDKVAERTRALARTNEELNIVLRQAGGRARNLKSLIEALARQTRTQTEDKAEFLDAFQERIGAMVDASDALTREDGILPDMMQALAETQLCAYLAAYPGRITLIGEDQRLSPRAARQIGLALNELATNAIKHGALLHDGGKVLLSWSRYRNWPDGAERFQLDWVETLPQGAPPLLNLTGTEAGGVLGYGSRVLNITVPQRLKGKAEVDYTPEGLSYALDLPLDCVLCPGAEFCGALRPDPVECAGQRAEFADWDALRMGLPSVDHERRSA